MARKVHHRQFSHRDFLAAMAQLGQVFGDEFDHEENAAYAEITGLRTARQGATDYLRQREQERAF